MRHVIGGVLVVLVAACSGGSGEDRSAVTSIPDDPTTTSSTTSTSTTVATVPVDVIPDDPALITEQYVEDVLNDLYGAKLEATLLVRREGIVTEEASLLTEATSSPAGAATTLNSLARLAREGFPNYRESPSQVDVKVLSLVEGFGPDCLVAEVETDFSRLLIDPGQLEPNERQFAVIVPASDEQTELNPTAWSLVGLRVTLDGSVITGSPCDET